VPEERQQHGKAQPVAVVLGHDERQIRRRQNPSLRGSRFIENFHFGRFRGAVAADFLQKPLSVKSAILPPRKIDGNGAHHQQAVKSAPVSATDAHERRKDFLNPLAVRRRESEGDAGAHAPDSHAQGSHGIPNGIQMSELIH
jgi:hypothetical protein